MRFGHTEYVHRTHHSIPVETRFKYLCRAGKPGIQGVRGKNTRTDARDRAAATNKEGAPGMKERALLPEEQRIHGLFKPQSCI